LAQKYGPDAVRAIAKLAKEADNDATKLAAWRELLDRGYGKARQPVSGDDDSPPIKHIHRVIIGPQNPDG